MAAAISILSEYLVDAIEVIYAGHLFLKYFVDLSSKTDDLFLVCWFLQGASLAWGVPVAFITVILLPIGGNTAAVTTSVMFAMKNKLVRDFSFHF